MTASTNYTGRKVDLCVSPGVSPAGASPVSLAFSDTLTICAGVQKLMQWVLVFLLTRRGSDPVDADYGSDLLEEVQRIAGTYEASSLISECLTELADYHRTNVEDEDTPEDEAILELTGRVIDYTTTTLTLELSLETKDDSLTVIVPISHAGV